MEKILDSSTPDIRPAQAIVAGRTCGNKRETMAPFFVKMLRDPPTKEEGKNLGFEYLVLLCQMQAHYRTFCPKDSKKRLEMYVQAVLEGVGAGDGPAMRLRLKELEGKKETPPSTRTKKTSLVPDPDKSEESDEYLP